MNKYCLVAYLNGIVQGVGMRYYVMKLATRLNLKGHVKNLTNGKVEVIAEGDEETLKQLLEYLRYSRVGYVYHIEENWEEPRNLDDTFKIR